LRIGEIHLTILASERPKGHSMNVSFDPKDVHVFNKDSGANVRSTSSFSSLRA
jgi:hypothetical protein